MIYNRCDTGCRRAELVLHHARAPLLTLMEGRSVAEEDRPDAFHRHKCEHPILESNNTSIGSISSIVQAVWGVYTCIACCFVAIMKSKI